MEGKIQTSQANTDNNIDRDEIKVCTYVKITTRLTDLDNAQVGILLQALPQLLDAEALAHHHRLRRLVPHARHASPGDCAGEHKRGGRSARKIR